MYSNFAARITGSGCPIIGATTLSGDEHADIGADRPLIRINTYCVAGCSVSYFIVLDNLFPEMECVLPNQLRWEQRS